MFDPKDFDAVKHFQDERVNVAERYRVLSLMSMADSLERMTTSTSLVALITEIQKHFPES